MNKLISIGLDYFRPAGDLRAKTGLLLTIVKVKHYLPKIGQLTGDQLKIARPLAFDHFDFRATSTAAYAAARKGAEQTGFKLLLERQHEGASQAGYARPGGNYTVAITGPAPAEDYSGRPAVFLDHIGFIFTGEGFDRAFPEEKIITLMAAEGLTPLKARMLLPEEMDRPLLSQTPAGKIILGFSRVEVFNQSPGEFLKQLKALGSTTK